MSWLVGDHNRHRTRIAKGAVPLGQHSHHVEEVLPLPDPPAPVELATVEDDVYVGLPTPAPAGRGCVRCRSRMAALVEPATGRAYCTDCWLDAVVLHQLD